MFGLVQGFGGTIDVESEIGTGACFRMRFPRTDAASRPKPADAVHSPTDTFGSGTILLVEDETLVRAGIRHFLTQLGYEVVDAASPKAALELLASRAEAIDLLLTDIVMPGMNGPELAKLVIAQRPATRVLFMSAFSDQALVEQGRLESGTPVLEKPFEEHDLERRVRELLANPAATQADSSDDGRS